MHDIAKFIEDIDDACEYCNNDISTSSHTIWACPFLKDLRINTDPELAKAPFKYAVYCTQCGIAPAMKCDRTKSYWGLDFDDETAEDVNIMLGED